MKNFLFACAVTIAAPASAEVIDFSSLAFDGDTTTPWQQYATVTVGDYVFTALQPATQPLLVHSRGDANNADPGGATLGIITSGDDLGFEFARVDGAAFDFLSFKATHFTNGLESPGNGGTLTLLLDGNLVFAGSYDVTPGFQDFAVNALGVHTVRISSNNYFQVDDLLVSSAVPEPATWGMMLLGFGMLGATIRFRRRGLAAA
jgi:hypothetical protein